MEIAKHTQLGREGENEAVAFLKSLGYDILRRNYRYLKAEVDIIAQIGNELVFVEVKTRSSSYFEDILDAINRRKERLIATAADHFIETNELDVEVRFDVIAVVFENQKTMIEHIPDAFYPFDNP